MIPEYRYQITDNSLITPFFKVRIVKPFMIFIPWRLPANIITIISNLFMIGALLVALFDFATLKVRLISAAILILLYAIGDHIDGMQAKRTKTSSALGEFFDHFLDAFNTGIFLITILTLFGINKPGIITFILLAAYLAHSSMIYEQYKTGWLIFDKIGSLEALLLASILLLISSITPVYQFLTSSEILNFTIVEILFIITAIGSLVTFVRTSLRARIIGFRFYLFCGMLTLTAFFSYIMFTNVIIFMVITLYAGHYIGNLMRGHLADGVERLPDLFIPVILVAGYFLHISGNSVFIALIFMYLLIVIFRLASGTIFTLREFWVWRNPAIKNLDFQPYPAQIK